MSKVCACPEAKKPVAARRWVVVSRNVTHSAFNGYRAAWSKKSWVACNGCWAMWRTAASYADHLKDGPVPGTKSS